jgi:hypothetical protein
MAGSKQRKRPARARKQKSFAAPALAGGANPALQPFRGHWSIVIHSGDGTSETHHVDVPAGKRLVIEFVTITAALPKRQHSVVTFYIRQSPTLRTPYWFHPRVVEPRRGTKYSHGLTQSTRIYADPATRVEVTASRGPATSSDVLVRVSFSGHLVDIP